VSPALLDINVLLALAWPNHQHHGFAHEWFAQHARTGWATCALTQLGFVRLSANPAYTPYAVSPAEAASLLGHYLAHPQHHFFASPPVVPGSVFSRALGHRQVNDAWLVAAAIHSGGRLVTFDAGVRAHALDPNWVEVIQTG